MHSFLVAILELEKQRVLVSSANTNLEAIENRGLLSTQYFQECPLTYVDLETFLEQLCAMKLRDAEQAAIPQLVVYVWCDLQALQLRYSFATSSHVKTLPFGCEYDSTATLVEIFRAFAAISGRTQWLLSELKSAGQEKPSTTFERPLMIYVRQLL